VFVKKCCFYQLRSSKCQSLVLSCLIYALPAWITMITAAHQQRSQRMHNCGVCIAASLRKFDHVSYHRHNFHWLSIPSLIRYRSLCGMVQTFYLKHDTSLDPPMAFGGLDHKRCTTVGCQINIYVQNVVDCQPPTTHFITLLCIGGIIYLMT